MQYLSIAIGGAVGSMARFFMTQIILNKNFPVGVLLVNSIGSFLIGILFVVFVEKSNVSETMRLLLMVGFLGAFTTFSTFSLDNLQLLQQGQIIKAGLNIFSNVLLGLLTVWLGFLTARYFI